MADFRRHITVSTVCGIAYGGLVVNPLGYSAETGFLAAGLTAVGGMIPDLDSDSGIPVREMSNLAAATIPLLLVPRLIAGGITMEGVLATAGFLYLFIRYVASWAFRKLTVHRGMFHSIPGMMICGLIVYLEYRSPNQGIRLLLAAGVMLGFFSHLALDELYSVDFTGARLRLNKSAGSALKFVSPSLKATCICYGVLIGLWLTAYAEFEMAKAGY